MKFRDLIFGRGASEFFDSRDVEIDIYFGVRWMFFVPVPVLWIKSNLVEADWLLIAFYATIYVMLGVIVFVVVP